MTGFGKTKLETNNKVINVEIRTLNSKQLDLNVRMPYLYKEKELEIRGLIGRELVRGKIDFSINIEQSSIDSIPEINKPLAKHYYHQIKSLSDELNIANPDISLTALLKMPDIFISTNEVLDKVEWEEILKGIKKTLDKVNNFRSHEGAQLYEDLTQRIIKIQDLLKEVAPFEKARVPRIRERIMNNLNTFVGDMSKDSERLEQEIIFYLEKLDITEEKIRLAQHCEYFIKIISSEENSGKKLGFVGQEIGREINTLGSKANDVDIQKIVVLMKDELEKIKEQLFNIL